MDLTQITETLYAIPVRLNLKDFHQSGIGFICGIDEKGYRIVLSNECLEHKIVIIGTVTQEEIDFDPSNYLESEIRGCY